MLGTSVRLACGWGSDCRPPCGLSFGSRRCFADMVGSFGLRWRWSMGGRRGRRRNRRRRRAVHACWGWGAALGPADRRGSGCGSRRCCASATGCRCLRFQGRRWQGTGQGGSSRRRRVRAHRSGGAIVSRRAFHGRTIMENCFWRSRSSIGLGCRRLLWLQPPTQAEKGDIALRALWSIFADWEIWVVGRPILRTGGALPGQSAPFSLRGGLLP